MPNSFYKTMVTLILKPHKDFIMNENFRPIFLMNNDAKKYSQMNISKASST